MTNYSKSLTTLILSAAVLASTGMAHAASYSSGVDLMKNIEFSQQDLSSAEGVNVIHNRVVEAAKDICTPNGNARSNIGLASEIRNCIADAVDQTFENANVEVLTSYHQALPKKFQHRRNKTGLASNWSVDNSRMAKMPSIGSVNALP